MALQSFPEPTKKDIDEPSKAIIYACETCEQAVLRYWPIPLESLRCCFCVSDASLGDLKLTKRGEKKSKETGPAPEAKGVERAPEKEGIGSQVACIMGFNTEEFQRGEITPIGVVSWMSHKLSQA